MSETQAEQLSSVYEFDEDIANAEPPVPLPLGEYRAEVKNVQNTVSKNSGKRMMVLTYVVPPDQYPADYVDGAPEGESMNVYFVVNNDARGRYRMRKFCEHHGVTPSRSVNANEFIGTQVIVKVSHEDYEGEKRARVNPVRAA